MSAPRDYDERVEQLRQHELERVEHERLVYLDYAGAALYTTSQVRRAAELLQRSTLCNPHSAGVLGARVLALVQNARDRVLAALGVTARTHAVVFTAGATAALKLVGECFEWSGAHAEISYTSVNHTSAVGVREYAAAAGAAITCVDVGDADLCKTLVHRHTPAADADADADTCAKSLCLFVFPAECNFSGIRLPLSWVDRGRSGEFSCREAPNRQNQQWFVLLDAAKFCATSHLDLSAVEADFTCLSFYKMFGLPTGLGALVIRRQSAFALSRKLYFGGGTLEASSSERRYHRLKKSLEERFEDGTISFASILTLESGFDLIQNSLGISRISRHCMALTNWTAAQMQALRHTSGASVCRLFGLWKPHSQSDIQFPQGTTQGPTIAFALLNSKGQILGHSVVEKLASSCRIQLRSGCFCNPGACQLFLNLSSSEVEAMHQAGHVCGDEIDFVNGRPTGCLRISLGFGTTFSDVSQWISFLKSYVVDAAVEEYSSQKIRHNVVTTGPEGSRMPSVQQLFVYPIKSCGAFEVQQWPLANGSGLLFDREFALLDSRGKILSQKQCPQMCLIKPSIDIDAQELVVVRADGNSVRISLQRPSSDADISSVKICGSNCFGIVMEDRYHNWFSQALQTQCQLIRFSRVDTQSKKCRRDSKISGFANEGQILLVSRESINAINSSWDSLRFRPNLVVETHSHPFEEEKWKTFRIGRALFNADKVCVRCSIIDIDQRTAEPGTRTFAELAKSRRKPTFGVLISHIRTLREQQCAPCTGVLLQRGQHVVHVVPAPDAAPAAP